MWKTNDYEPAKALEMIDSFENIEQLGNTSFADDIDTIIDDISRKNYLGMNMRNRMLNPMINGFMGVNI